MKIFAIVDLIIILLILLGFYTQVFKPLWKGTQLFPYFNRKRQQLEKKVAEIHEEAEQEQMQEYIKRQSRFRRNRSPKR
jgi:hypothetical protein